ncbi:MAG: exosortase/archaeosortase family protein [Candidatus Bathyarchaeia archaeon]
MNKTRNKSLQMPLLNQSNLLLATKIGTIIFAIIALFHQDLSIIFADALQSEETSYMLAIPFILAYLVYRKRKMLKAVMPLANPNQPKETRFLPAIAGAMLSITAVLIFFYGSKTFTPLEYRMSAIPVFAAGLVLLLFNPQTLRQLAFSIAFLAFLTPPPLEILYDLGATMSVISSEASNAIISLMGIPSTITSEYGNPTIIITRPDGTPIHFTIEIACSGIYSLIGFIVFATLVAYVVRDKLWKKLAIVLIGLPLIYLLNILRITLILILGYHYGENIALQLFHLLGGGVLIFLGTLLILVVSEKVLKTQFFTTATKKCLECNPTPPTSRSFCLACGRVLKPEAVKIKKSDMVKIITVIAVITLLTSIQVPVFAMTQGPPLVIINNPLGEQVSTEILPEISGYNLSFFYRDTQFEAKAKQDLSLVYLYQSLEKGKGSIWATVEVAQTRAPLHRWEICLITYPETHGYQPKVTQIELKDVQLASNPPIIGRYFAFQYKKTGFLQAVLYWFETATFTVNSTSQQKHVKISLISYPESMDQLQSNEDTLVTIATRIANYWQPIKTWSQITMLISQNSIMLISVTVMLLTATIIVYEFGLRKQKKENLNAYEKLSKTNKQLTDLILETEKVDYTTLETIKTTYQKTYGETIDKNELLEKLTKLEDVGIIKRVIGNRQDEPILVWKLNI